MTRKWVGRKKRGRERVREEDLADSVMYLGRDEYARIRYRRDKKTGKREVHEVDIVDLSNKWPLKEWYKHKRG